MMKGKGHTIIICFLFYAIQTITALFRLIIITTTTMVVAKKKKKKKKKKKRRRRRRKRSVKL